MSNANGKSGVLPAGCAGALFVICVFAAFAFLGVAVGVAVLVFRNVTGI